MIDLTGAPYAYVAGDPLNATDPVGLCSHWNPLCDASELAHAAADHWHGIAQATTVVVAGVGATACVAMTAGACVAALPVIGAATSAALYAESGGSHDLSGYVKASAEGAAGGALAALCTIGGCEIGGSLILGGAVVNGAWGAGQGAFDYRTDVDCRTFGGYAKAAGIGFVEGGVPWDLLWKYVQHGSPA
jgi:hypothetical protein